MKKIIFTIVPVLMGLLLVGCPGYTDDYYHENDGTDFNSDISDITDFYLSTPVELQVLNKNIVNDTLVYKIGDTLKLKLELNSIHSENAFEKYDLFKSTGALKYNYNIYIRDNYLAPPPITHITDPYFVNYIFYKNNPILKELGLSKEEILSSPTYKNLYINSSIIEANYHISLKSYKAEFGIVFKNKTSLDENGKKLPASIYIGEYIRNEWNENGINISVPVISILNNIPLIVTE